MIVVHGVGDPQPGETISLFARSLADQATPLVERDATIWLEEKSADHKKVKTFPAHRRLIKLQDRTVEMCEVFWGDLSRVRRGWLGLIQGIFQILFGLRYVAYVAGDQPGRSALYLKSLGMISSRVLHGPVAAVTCFLGLLIAAVCGTHMVWPGSHKLAIWTKIVLFGCSAVGMVAAEIGGRYARSRVFERFWFWMSVTVAFVTGVMLLRMLWLDQYYPALAHTSEMHPGLLWYCRTLVILLGMLWFIEIQVIVLMAICWACALRHRKTYAPSLHVALLLPALAVGIWGWVIPMAWLAAKESIEALAQLKEFSNVFDDAIPFLGVQFVMMVLLTVTLVYVIASYARWRTRDPEGSFAAGRAAPRLIVHGSLQSMLGVCTVMGVALVSSLWLLNMTQRYETYVESTLGRAMEQANGYAITFLVPIGGLLFFVLPKLRPGFDMILDVVNHFYFRPTNVDDVLDDDDQFDMSETTFANGTLFFSRRDQLHGRMKRILAHYRDRYSHHPELVVASHSQGTMVAIETLNDPDMGWLNNSFRRITLATMGSPFNHMYQHYFRLCYPMLDQPFWSAIRRRVDCWVNIFRVDDYVGTQIEFPDSLLSNSDFPSAVDEFDAAGNPRPISDPFLMAPQTGTQPLAHQMECHNFPLGPRGHLNYWCDTDVLDLLKHHALRLEELDRGKRRVA